MFQSPGIPFVINLFSRIVEIRLHKSVPNNVFFKNQISRMSLKYKSPLIRSRNTSAVLDSGSTPASPSLKAESPVQQANNGPAGAQFDDNVLVYDNKPQQPSPVAQNWRGGRGFGSPRFNSPRPPSRASPYQWTPPHNRHNNSYSSDVRI